MTLYSVAALVLRSAVPLPELPLADGRRTADWSFRLAGPATPWPERVVADVLSDDVTALQVARDGERWLLRFPDVADFVVDRCARLVECRAAPGTDDVTVRHLFLDHVVPRLVSVRGDLVLHASAVVTPFGAVGFLGASGSGKSTLAASFATNGFPLLADDFLCLREEEGQFLASPSYPGLRLWPDAIACFAPPGARIHPVTSYNDKGRLADPGSPAPSLGRTPLAALFMLDVEGPYDPHTLTVTKAPGQVAFLAVLQAAFRLSPTDRSDNQPEFERIVRLLEVTDVVQISLREDFSALAQARALILSILSEPPGQRATGTAASAWGAG